MKETADPLLRLRLAYAGTLAAWVLASFVPGLRFWGLGFLSPLEWPSRVLVVAVLAGLYFALAGPFARRWEGAVTPGSGFSPSRWKWIVAAAAVALFVLLRGQTHFLGDASERLSRLVEARLRGGSEFTLTLPLLQAASRLGWEEGAAALRAYQLVSMGSGALCVLIVFQLARRVFDSPARAFLFALGQLSAGYMLVFFGYVENHALFVLATIAFVSAGVAACRQRAAIAWAVVCCAVAIAADPLGICLLPALGYLALRHTRWAVRWRNVPLWLQGTVVIVPVAVAIVLLARWYDASPALRIALLSPFKDRLTVDGYTLPAVDHLLDLVNLALLLLPGCAVVLALRPGRPVGERRESATVFLWWVCGSAWLVAALLDPPLGMPRSWDRFAFAGVPLAAWAYYRTLSQAGLRAVTAALLCAALSGGALLSRAWVQARPEASVTLAMSYFRLDPGRSRSGVITVGQYLLDHNTTSIYGVLEDFRRKHYPEEALRERLNFLMRDKKQLEAADVCQLIIRHDPRFASAWMFLGFIYNNAGRFDSASTYLAVADALDPHNTAILNELGRAYYFSGQRARAVALWKESLAEDALQYVPHLALATWYKDEGNPDSAFRHLQLATTRPGVPGETFLELARLLAAKGRTSEARAAYEQAVALEADSIKAAKLLKDYPEIGPPAVDPAKSM